MAKFNLKKQAEKDNLSKSYPKRLSSQNDDRGYAVDSTKKVETIQGKLSETRKDEKNTTTYENRMSEARLGSPDNISENQIDNSKSYYPHRQNNEARPHIKPNDLLAESYDQAYYAKFADADDAQSTEFWDKEIGVQLSGEKTTIVSQVPANGSQLQNHPDRFKSTKERETADGIDPSGSDSAVKDDNKMVMTSSLQKIDEQIFQLFYKASSSDRELTSEENSRIDELTVAKTELLSSK